MAKWACVTIYNVRVHSICGLGSVYLFGDCFGLWPNILYTFDSDSTAERHPHGPVPISYNKVIKLIKDGLSVIYVIPSLFLGGPPIIPVSLSRSCQTPELGKDNWFYIFQTDADG